MQIRCDSRNFEGKFDFFGHASVLPQINTGMTFSNSPRERTEWELETTVLGESRQTADGITGTVAHSPAFDLSRWVLDLRS